ncbi:MAG: hypothetical protein FWC97_07400 [Treponema sp.]|nr:hypothetical protein [Treponema sp.]
MEKFIKLTFKLLILTSILLTACFNPFESNEGILTINFDGNSGGRSAFSRAGDNGEPQRQYRIRLYRDGDSTPITILSEMPATTVRASVPAGSYILVMEAWLGGWHGEDAPTGDNDLYAKGTLPDVEIIGGRNNYFRVPMELSCKVCRKVPCDCTGTGDRNDPFRIRTPEDLQRIGTGNWALDKYYRLVGTITLLDSENRSPIGNHIARFEGNFDGYGNTIRNLTFPLFGEIGTDGTVHNLTLDRVNIEASGGTVGSVAGVNRGTVKNVSVIGTVVSSASPSANDHDIGGLVGINYGTVKNSRVELDVKGGAGIRLGGLIGHNIGAGTVRNSFVTGNVTRASGHEVGGLVGRNDGIVENSFATGDVTSGSGNHVGGLVGYNTGTVKNSFATGDVTSGSGNHVGGLVGSNTGFVQYNIALNQNVSSAQHTGRVVGHDTSPSGLSNNFAFGGMRVNQNTTVTPGGSHGNLHGQDRSWDELRIRETWAIGGTSGPSFVFGETGPWMWTGGEPADVLPSLYDVGKPQDWPTLNP